MATQPIKDDAQAALYEEYGQSVDYTQEDGLLVLPVSDGPPVVVRVHEPYTVRRQRFKARKKRTPPVFPAPRPDGPLADGVNSVCVGQTVSVPLPEVTQGNPPVTTFEISGEYVYVESAGPDGKLHSAANGLPGPGFPPAGQGGTQGRPFNFPVMDTAAALQAAIGGGAIWPLLVTPAFTSGRYDWPATTIAPAFADPTLS